MNDLNKPDYICDLGIATTTEMFAFFYFKKS